MNMTLYCGPLTRYYAHNWKGAAPLSGERLPLPELEDIACRWRDMACGAVEEELGVQMYWEESSDGRYFTACPGWEGWYGLILWALYREQDRVPEPLPEDWLQRLESLPVLAEEHALPHRYPTLAANCELFLPMDADVVINGPEPSGAEEIPMGSAKQLLIELELLNEDCWKATDKELASWETLKPVRLAQGYALEPFAKKGFACLYRIAKAATVHSLPVRLDYGD